MIHYLPVSSCLDGFVQTENFLTHTHTQQNKANKIRGDNVKIELLNVPQIVIIIGVNFRGKRLTPSSC